MQTKPALRPYQTSVYQQVFALLAAQHRSIISVCPTGSGKTVMYAAIAQTLSATGFSVLILEHREELVAQASQKIRALGLDHGLVKAGTLENISSTIVIASVQTLVRRITALAPPDFIIIDEAHHALESNSWGKILGAFPNSKRLGFTATPCRMDGRGLGETFEKMVCGPEVLELIEAGFLATYRLFVPKVLLDLASLPVVRGDYEQSKLAEALGRSSVYSDAVDNYRRRCSGRRAIAFCVNLKHAAEVAARFMQEGIAAEVIDGTMGLKERRELLARFSKGEVFVLVSCSVVSEGTDIPEAEVALMLRPTKSLALWLQMAGRVLRVTPKKKEAVLLDLVGGTLEHGLICDRRDWSLEGVKRRKKKGVAGPAVVICESCFSAHRPAPRCPFCSNVNKVQPAYIDEQKREALVEAKKEELRRIQAEKKKEVSSAKTMQELRAIEKARCYKPGWAEHVFRSRQGRRGVR